MNFINVLPKNTPLYLIRLTFLVLYFIFFQQFLNSLNFDMSTNTSFYVNVFFLSFYFSSIIGALFLFFKINNSNVESFIYTGFSVGLIGYLDFFAFAINPKAGIVVSIVFKIILAHLIVNSYHKINSELKIETFKISFLLIFLINLIIIVGTINKFDYTQINIITANIYGLTLPMDNWLPKIFADQLVQGKILTPMIGDWLSSDRPPLQTGMYLLFTHSLLNDINYLVYSVGMQLLIIIFLMLVFQKIYNSKTLLLSLLLLITFNSMVFVNCLFVWPKMLSAFYQAIAFYYLYEIAISSTVKTNPTKFFGIAFILAFLSHGGSIFYLFSLLLILFFVLFKTNQVKKSFNVFVYTFFIYTPWMFYQKFIDPPGDRLLKWHLADHIPITNDSFVTVLYAKYSSFSFESYINYKLTQINTVFSELFSKYIALFHDSNLTIIEKSFFYQEYSYFFLSSLFLLLLFFIKIDNAKEKIFLYLMTSSYILYNLIWTSLLMSKPVLHHGSSFGWFSGLIAIFLTLHYLNKNIAFLMLLANLVLFTNSYLKYTNHFNTFISEKQIILTNFIEKDRFNEFISYTSSIKGDQDIGKIRFIADKHHLFIFKTGPVVNNQFIKIIDKNQSILSVETLTQSDDWKAYSFSDRLPASFTVEISDQGTRWGEWSAVAFKKGENDTK